MMKRLLVILLYSHIIIALNQPCNSFNKIENTNCLAKNTKALSSNYVLPKLPYAYDALEPYIDAKTMEIHYTKHHQKYVDDLNRTLENYPHLLGKPIEYLLKNIDEVPKDIRSSVINFGGGHLNHSMFWLMLTPQGRKQPQGPLKKALVEQFKSFHHFKQEFNKASRELFGSGWTWLCVNGDKKLVVMTTKDQDNPLSIGLKPILCFDLWEHAYYLKHQNRRIDYIDTWWHLVNWAYVENNYKEAIA